MAAWSGATSFLCAARGAWHELQRRTAPKGRFLLHFMASFSWNLVNFLLTRGVFCLTSRLDSLRFLIAYRSKSWHIARNNCIPIQTAHIVARATTTSVHSFMFHSLGWGRRPHFGCYSGKYPRESPALRSVASSIESGPCWKP